MQVSLNFYSELSHNFIFVFRRDCLKLLTQCTNSTSVPLTVCDIIAPTSSESYCISVDQFLQPSLYGNSVISPIQEKINNPCDPNPCAEGFFCVINRHCRSQDQSCTSYECQPGCVVGAKPGFILPEGSGVRVSLVSHSEMRCFGYFNCSSTYEDIRE